MKNDWDDLIKMVDKNEIDKIVEIYKEMEEKEYEYFIDKLTQTSHTYRCDET